MLSSLSRVFAHAALRPLLQSSSKQIGVLSALYATFNPRDLLAASQGESGTLTARFVKHIALENCKTDPLVPQKIKYSDYYPLTDFRGFHNSLQEINTDQIPRLIVFTYTFKTNGDPQKVTTVLNEIDALCLDRVNSMDQKTLLSVLYAFMYLLPNKITKFDFFSRCIERLVKELENDCPKEQFVQIAFYLGLWKKHRRSIDLVNHIKDNHLNNYIGKLNRIEFAIVANALFKSGTICESPEFKQRLLDEVLVDDDQDNALLVTFIKSLRLSRIKSEAVYNKLEKFLESGNLNSLQFKGLAHIFAYFAEGFHNEPKICGSLIEQCMNKLETINSAEQYIFNDVRPKDLATFIWSCAYLNSKELLADHIDFITELILSKVDREEYTYEPDALIDTALSLWVLGHQSENVTRAVFDLPPNPRLDSSDRVKLDSRLELLRSCVQIEQPKWMPSRGNRKEFVSFDALRPAQEYSIKNRDNLQNVSNIILENKDDLGIGSVKLVTPIHQLNVAGIFLELDNGGKCFVEVLEANHLLKFGNKPVAIVALKLRLLEHLGYNTVVIQPDATSKEQVLAVLKENLNDMDPKLSIKTVAT